MTKKEAIKVLRTESVEIGGNAVSVTRWLMALDMAVKALDAVPVVRCGQCKFDNFCCRNVGKDGKRTKDDFCSYGERKEGAD